MNENLNLVEILKDCPEGTKLYSPIIGEVEFKRIKYCEYPIVTRCKNGDHTLSFTKEGLFYSEGVQGECIMLFPSKNQRDWSKFERFWDKSKSERFDPKTLQPFDKVLAKDGFPSKWTCSFFSHMDNDVSFPVYCSGGYFKVCIPYNEETKHLIGTSDDCPEYYKWWKDEQED